MSPEESRKLIDLYPELFSGLDSRQAFSLFGFECGPGWFDLLKDLIIEIKALGLKDLRVSQVKQKFGTLRFYTNWTTDELEDAVEKAEGRSEETCEICGKPGNLRKSGMWYHTSCDECTKEVC